jgi:hypothetical protein
MRKLPLIRPLTRHVSTWPNFLCIRPFLEDAISIGYGRLGTCPAHLKDMLAVTRLGLRRGDKAEAFNMDKSKACVCSESACVFIVRARVHKGLSIPTANNQTIRVNNASHDQQELQLARFARQDVSDSNVIRDGGTAVGLSDELGIENSLVRLEFG